MSLNVVIGILMAVHDGQAPMTAALSGALNEALGPTSSIVIRQAASVSDSDALGLEAELHATAVVELAWAGPSRTRAAVRIHLAGTDRWIARQIDFLPGDSWSERGRTLGFDIAAILLPQTDAAAPGAQEGPRPETPDARDTAAGPAAVRRAAARSGAAPPASFSVDLSAVGSLGVDGPAEGLGAEAGGEVTLGSSLSLRLGAGVRSGDVANLNGTDVVVSANAGLAWRPLAATPERPLGVGIRAAALGLYHDLSHRESDGRTVRHGRFLPGVMSTIEGTWRLNRVLDAVAGLGAEVALGATDVLVAGRTVATIPPFRVLVDLGLRLRF